MTDDSIEELAQRSWERPWDLLHALIDAGHAYALDAESVDMVEDYRLHHRRIADMAGDSLEGVEWEFVAETDAQPDRTLIAHMPDGKIVREHVDGSTDWIDVSRWIRFLNAVMDRAGDDRDVHEVWDEETFGQGFAVLLAGERDAVLLKRAGLPITTALPISLRSESSGQDEPKKEPKKEPKPLPDTVLEAIQWFRDNQLDLPPSLEELAPKTKWSAKNGLSAVIERFLRASGVGIGIRSIEDFGDFGPTPDLVRQISTLIDVPLHVEHQYHDLDALVAELNQQLLDAGSDLQLVVFSDERGWSTEFLSLPADRVAALGRHVNYVCGHKSRWWRETTRGRYRFPKPEWFADLLDEERCHEYYLFDEYTEYVDFDFETQHRYDTIAFALDELVDGRLDVTDVRVRVVEGAQRTLTVIAGGEAYATDYTDEREPRVVTAIPILPLLDCLNQAAAACDLEGRFYKEQRIDDYFREFGWLGYVLPDEVDDLDKRGLLVEDAPYPPPAPTPAANNDDDDPQPSAQSDTPPDEPPKTAWDHIKRFVKTYL